MKGVLSYKNQNRANQSAGFYIIGTSVIKMLKGKNYATVKIFNFENFRESWYHFANYEIFIRIQNIKRSEYYFYENYGKAFELASVCYREKYIKNFDHIYISWTVMGSCS